MISTGPKNLHDRIVVAIVLVLIGYGISAMMGLPQRATEMVVAATDMPAEMVGVTAYDSRSYASPPPSWMVLPFVVLLAAIALMPLLGFTAHWWESNLHKLFVAGGLAFLTLAYYLFYHHYGMTVHWPADQAIPAASSGLAWHALGAVLVNAIIGEFLPFIILLFSLYTITGGIRIEGDLRAHSLTNTLILAIGAVLASLIGTTGAAMLLIRLLLETNSERKRVKHTMIMFIFIVCNCGGCLLPLGDPPLFLGYLFGVPFFWTLRLWPAWLLTNGLLLAIYFLWDHFWHYPREAATDVRRDETRVRPLRMRGLWPNAWILAGVVLAVALLDPGKPLLGTSWHPWVYLREIALLGFVLLSLLFGPDTVRRDNGFDFGAINEVAVLFLGIFLCMQPPLEILQVNGPSLGLVLPAHFFWASGSLSSVLDNAPTYAVFFETAKSLGGSDTVAGVQGSLLAAVSLGSVFMGAMTYIGNGPNFMVKAIAEKSGVVMPTFFGYIAYSAAILLPIFVLVTLLFMS
ncbi:MAG: sodium:proton antiporter [Planctomycetota bacterium]